ncbi:protein of unknown function (DUF3353) [Rubidibacter lacunae KORDI 51-2]|uniref:Molecular chaperone DnaJ n=1 Tax=Rubidibacter lacunae KORDI 51-2 TaxID=582515 RepID=U5DK67_9CHRO|nr:CPP1-like family protein [Rubidibacter lacunae]ERN40969.1 protein of unknown function (DUF3353) [Rubidibacter lacunae KORDI 51-2]
MSEQQSPFEQLGVTEDASFEEIQDAKRRLNQEHSGDSKVIETVEAAYDAIIMERLRLRQEGKIKVPERIRFPERTVEPPPTSPLEHSNSSPPWLQGLLDTPSRADLLLSSGIFIGLVLLTLLVPNSEARSLSLLLPLGFGACGFLLTRKERRFGRSLLLSGIALAVGIGLGAVLSPIAGRGMEEAHFISLVSFFFLWLVSSFMR